MNMNEILILSMLHKAVRCWPCFWFSNAPHSLIVLITGSDKSSHSLNLDLNFGETDLGSVVVHSGSVRTDQTTCQGMLGLLYVGSLYTI